MRSKLGVLAAVFRNPTLRRLEAAYLIFAFGEWSTWVAVIVYAYGRGGAAEAGVVAFVELAPSVVLAPLAAGLGDRFPRSRVLFGSYATQALLMAATAIGLGTAAPALIIYVLATVTASAVASSRPLHASLLPEVVASPDDLTAANVTSGMAESAGSLLGPLGAGLLVGLGGPTAVFAVACLGNLVGAALVATALAHQAGGGRRPRARRRPNRSRRRSGRSLALHWLTSWRGLRHPGRPPAPVGRGDHFVGDVPRRSPRHLLRRARHRALLGLDGGGVGFVGAHRRGRRPVLRSPGSCSSGERLACRSAASTVLFGGGDRRDRGS